MKRRWAVILLMSAVIAGGEWLLLYWLPVRRVALSSLTVTFFDVGQGDSILLEQGKHRLLVDGGPNRVVLSRLGKQLSYFSRQLDAIIATHPHDDHTAGLEALFGRYQIGSLMLPESQQSNQGFSVLIAEAQRNGTEIVSLSRGAIVWLSGSVALTVLWPPNNCAQLMSQVAGHGSHYDSANSCSLVLRLDNCDQQGCRRALLMGDATAATERWLLQSGDELAADLVKIGHHGSRYSSCQEFIQAVRPDRAVIQVGQPNRFGHPDFGVVLRLRALAARVWRNDQHGTISAQADTQGFRLEPQKVPEPDT